MPRMLEAQLVETTTVPAEILLTAVLIDTETAARLLGISPSTLRAHMRRGDIVARYSGTKPLFLLDDLHEFAASLPREPRAL